MPEPFLYYLHDEADAFRLQLAGCLFQDCTQELDQARQTASSVFNGRPLIVDVTRLESVDAAGLGLIVKWHDLGAQLVVTTPHSKARIESLTGVPIRLLARKQSTTWLRRAAHFFAPATALLMIVILMGQVR